MPIFIDFFFFNFCFQLWDVLPCKTGEFTVIKPDILNLVGNSITDRCVLVKNHLVPRHDSDVRNSRKLPLWEAFFHISSAVSVMLLQTVADTDESFALDSLKSSFLISTCGAG